MDKLSVEVIHAQKIEPSNAFTNEYGILGDNRIILFVCVDKSTLVTRDPRTSDQQRGALNAVSFVKSNHRELPHTHFSILAKINFNSSAQFLISARFMPNK